MSCLQGLCNRVSVTLRAMSRVLDRSPYLLALPLILTAACTPAGEMAAVDDSTGATQTDGETMPTVDDTTGPAPMPFCGDGMVDVDEECDEGEDNSDNGACKDNCEAAVCGDGLVHEGTEACDDGNDDENDGCSAACEITPICGDGTVDEGEECDNGRDNGPDGECLADCTVSQAGACGNGRLDSGEQCDDGNDDNNDACTELCAPPTCGDGFAQTVNSELCDDGDEIEGDECNSDCTTAGLWTDTFNGDADNNDVVHGVAADSAGNVIAAGVTFDGGQGDDVWLRKYDPDGSVQWTTTFHGITADVGYAVATDGSDEIFVAGSTFTLDEGTDTWLRHYNAAGDPVWTRTFDGTASGADQASGVAVDGAGNVVVVGYTTSSGSSRDIWIRKYNAGGTTQWTDTVSSGGSNNEEGHGITTDAMGNVIATGYLWAGGDAQDIWVRKYDADGDVQWTQSYGGAAGGRDEGNGVAADSAGNVVVVGHETTGTERDIWVRKYDAAGSEVWTQTYNAPQNENDSARGVAIDGDDAVIVAGSVSGGVQFDNIWVRKYDSDGNELWTSTYNADPDPGFGSDVANGVAVDPDGNIAVGGSEVRTGEARNTWVRRILQ